MEEIFHPIRAQHGHVLSTTRWRDPESHPATQGGESNEAIYPVRVRNEAFGDTTTAALMADAEEWWSIALIDADGRWRVAAPTWDDDWREAHARCVVTGWCFPDELGAGAEPATAPTNMQKVNIGPGPDLEALLQALREGHDIVRRARGGSDEEKTAALLKLDTTLGAPLAAFDRTDGREDRKN